MGRLTRRMGLFLTPEESETPRVLVLLDEHMALLEAREAQRPPQDVSRNVRDPGICALHLALLPQRPVKKRHRHQLKALIYQVVEEGAEKISAPDRRSLISDPESLSIVHTLSWSAPPSH
jgi:membrane glycosyltransferase